MKTFLIILLLLCPALALAQQVDCSSFQQQVEDLKSTINYANASLLKTQMTLDHCQSIETVVKSDEYKTAISAISVGTKEGVNWGSGQDNIGG